MTFISGLGVNALETLRKHYAVDEHGQLLRPWQLGFRADYSISGVIDPETCELLMELMLSEGWCPRLSVTVCASKSHCCYEV